MAKLSKKQLKNIVKECLVEILQEGISTNNSPPVNVPKQRPKRASSTSRPALDSVRFENVVSEAVGSLTDDPVLSSIFADTAKTTLQEQYASQGSPLSGDTVTNSIVSPESDAIPTDAFGDAAKNWAALAFPEKKTP
jgi:hypothetical protein